MFCALTRLEFRHQAGALVGSVYNNGHTGRPALPIRVPVPCLGPELSMLGLCG